MGQLSACPPQGHREQRGEERRGVETVRRGREEPRGEGWRGGGERKEEESGAELHDWCREANDEGAMRRTRGVVGPLKQQQLTQSRRPEIIPPPMAAAACDPTMRS